MLFFCIHLFACLFYDFSMINIKFSQFKKGFREFPGNPVVRTTQLSLPRVWVQSLIGELRSQKLHVPPPPPKKKKKKRFVFLYLRYFLGERNDSSLQFSCLGNPMDRGAWWATVHRVARVTHN